MDANDPRHGQYAGAVQHWFDGETPCPPCQTAETRYRKNRQLRHLRGEDVTVPSIGTIRRHRALMALGWTGPQIAKESGVSINTLRNIAYHDCRVVHANTAHKIAEAYDRMSMVIPNGPYAGRTRLMAARKGWAVPLAWDEHSIDDPKARPHSKHAKTAGLGQDHLDHAVVERVLGGEGKPRILTAAETREIIRRALDKGHSTYEIAQLYGIKVERHHRQGTAA